MLLGRNRKMEMHDKLIRIFNSAYFDLKRSGGIVEIKEKDSLATVKNTEWEYHGQLMTISNELFNKTDFLFKTDKETDAEMPKLQHGCDGVLVVERKEEKYIVFIELKSEYSNTNIRKAEKQLCASYLRIMALLNCLEDEDFIRYKKCGIIVSHPLSTETLTRIQKKKNVGSKLSRYERQCLVFSSSDPRVFPLDKKYAQLEKLPVKSCLYFEELPTVHCNVNHNCSTGHFNLDAILKSLK